MRNSEHLNEKDSWTVTQRKWGSFFMQGGPANQTGFDKDSGQVGQRTRFGIRQKLLLDKFASGEIDFKSYIRLLED